MKIDPSKTIADIIAETPASSSVLQRFGIDCGRASNVTLDLACREAGAPVATVLHFLQEVAAASGEEQAQKWNEVSLTILMKHIVEKHHAYCREQLERLDPLLNTVVRRHGEHHPELRRIQSAFLKMGNDLKQHLLKEEQTLFPMIARMEEARVRQAAVPRFPFGTIANPIRMMILEHDTGNRELDEIRKLTSSYQIPPDADAEYEELLRRLRDFEQDMKQHVLLEDDRLFPRAIALEQGGAARASSHS